MKKQFREYLKQREKQGKPRKRREAPLVMAQGYEAKVPEMGWVRNEALSSPRAFIDDYFASGLGALAPSADQSGFQQFDLAAVTDMLAAQWLSALAIMLDTELSPPEPEGPLEIRGGKVLDRTGRVVGP